MVIVDSSVWIFALRRDFHPWVSKRVAQALAEGEVGIIGIIAVEILQGAKSKSEFDRLKSRLDALTVIETTAELWAATADLAFHLRGNGVRVPAADLLIATAAISAKALLLHADSHFDVIARHADLRVESLVKKVR